MNSTGTISRSEIADLFKKFDTRGNGTTLSFTDFYEMLKYKSRQEKEDVINISAARFFFTGAAISKSTEITQSEVEYLFTAFNSTDPVEFAKLVFRSLDTTRKGTIGSEEIEHSSVIFSDNSPITELLSKVEQEIEGTDQRINFARFIELTTGEVIDSGFDPYDGNLQKSKCCILI